MNYILLFPDELRAESLGCYGHPLVHTPNIDALAAEGTVFEQNYTTHPVCGPARCNLASGWYPHVDGRRTFYMISDKNPNFISHLNDAGFTTAHGGKDDMFDHASMERIFGELLPFHRRDVVKTQGLKAIPQARYSMIYPPVKDEDEPKLGDALHTADAIDFIHRHGKDEKPFFLMLSWMFPHPPYTAPESYYNMYDPADVPMRRDLSWYKENKPRMSEVLRRYRETDDKGEDLFRKMNAVYLGMISYVDTLVGRIVEALKKEDIYEDTTIIFCSDHGDYAGDGGQTEKWPSDMTDMITRVPLIIRRPGCPGGHRVSTPTQSFDIFPTILDYENVKLHYAQFGVSLKPQIEGAPGDSERAAYSEGGYDVREPWCFEPECFKGTYLESPQIEGTDYYPKCLQQQEAPDTVCRVVMQRYKDWKLMVRTNGQNELYNMKDDPWEAHNLYGKPEYKKIQDELTQKMLTWLIDTSDVVPIEGRG